MAEYWSRHFEAVTLHPANSCMRHDLRDRPRAARGQQFQFTISAGAEPLDDCGRQDALALPDDDEITTLRLEFDRQRTGTPASALAVGG